MAISKTTLMVGVVALAATLASCSEDRVAAIRSVAKATCGVLPSVASVVAVTATGQPLAGAAADAVAKAICTTYAARISVASLPLVGDKQCPKVGDTCVWAEKVDLDKLKEYAKEQK